jgi:hypothetical protein
MNWSFAGMERVVVGIDTCNHMGTLYDMSCSSLIVPTMVVLAFLKVHLALVVVVIPHLLLSPWLLPF